MAAIRHKYIDGIKLRVWHVPQLPCEAFHWEVDTLQEAAKVIELLNRYDEFQLDQKIKPDYASVNDVEVHDGLTNEWYDWHHPENDMGFDELAAAELFRLDTIYRDELKEPA